MKYIRTFKTIEDYNTEIDTLTNSNVSLVGLDNSLHYNENYFELIIESVGPFKIPIYFTKSDYDNRESSYVFKGDIGISVIRFNHKIYDLGLNKGYAISNYNNNNNIIKITIKGSIIHPIYLFSTYNLSNTTIIIDFSKLNNNYITTLEGMFYYYSYLNNENTHIINVTNLCKKYVKSIKGIFSGCFNLTHLIGLNTWDTSNCENMDGSFHGIMSLDNINDVNTWNTENVKTFRYTFSGIGSPNKTITLNNLNTKSCTNFSYMFYQTRFEYIYGLENWDVSKGDNFSNMFYSNNNKVLKYVNVSTWNMVSATRLDKMFYGYIGSVLDLSKWSLPNVTTLSNFLYYSENLLLIDARNWNPKLNKDLSYAFRCSNGKCISIYISNWDNDELLNMIGCFMGQKTLRNIDLTNFKTPKVTTMSSVFRYDSSILELDCSSFITKYVTSTEYMFNGCSSLIKLNICNFDNTSLTTMSNMFNGCTSLNQLIIGPNFFNSTTLTTYSFKDLTNWTESSSLAILVNSIPISSTTKTIEISINTSNALTIEQKASIVDKNWIISVF